MAYNWKYGCVRGDTKKNNTSGLFSLGSRGCTAVRKGCRYLYLLLQLCWRRLPITTTRTVENYQDACRNGIEKKNGNDYVCWLCSRSEIICITKGIDFS